MKEWALKHPILTFLLVDAITYNLFVTVKYIVNAIKGPEEKEENAEEKEEAVDECDSNPESDH